MTPATYGDTGARFMGTFAAGIRLALGSHFTLRLEVRDVAYSASVDRVNGCSASELDSGQCGNFATPTDARLAWHLVRLPGSAVLHNVGMYLGGGFVF